MKTALTAAVLLAACFSVTQPAKAQSTSIDVFDYAVYFASPDTTGWYIRWIDDDGSVADQWGAYDSEQAAWDRVYWAFFGGHEVTGYAEVVELTMPPVWQHYQTFDTYEEATFVAMYFEYLGLLADVRTVVKYDLRATVSPFRSGSFHR